MSLLVLKTFFLWTTIVHFSIMILWILLLKFAREWFRKQQALWFPLPENKFMEVHYLMYGGYKLAVLVFSAIPYLVLVMLGA